MSDTAVTQICLMITAIALAAINLFKTRRLKEDVKDTKDAVKEADLNNRDMTSTVAAKVDATRKAVHSVHEDAVAAASEAKDAATVAADNTTEIKQIVNGERAAMLAEIAALRKENVELKRKTAP